MADNLSFNAATAMRPWRTFLGDSTHRAASTLQCGHGHEAVENGGEGAEKDAVAQLLQCGHGHEAVENKMLLETATHSSWLQCGHGHEAVENLLYQFGLGEWGRFLLQCGHGHEAVENIGGRRKAGLTRGASMRPRP